VDEPARTEHALQGSGHCGHGYIRQYETLGGREGALDKVETGQRYDSVAETSQPVDNHSLRCHAGSDAGLTSPVGAIRSKTFAGSRHIAHHTVRRETVGRWPPPDSIDRPEDKLRLQPIVLSTRMRAIKVARLARTPRVWRLPGPALRSGVFPSLDHGAIRFGADHVTVVDVGLSHGQFALFALSLSARGSLDSSLCRDRSRPRARSRPTASSPPGCAERRPENHGAPRLRATTTRLRCCRLGGATSPCSPAPRRRRRARSTSTHSPASSRSRCPGQSCSR